MRSCKLKPVCNSPATLNLCDMWDVFRESSSDDDDLTITTGLLLYFRRFYRVNDVCLEKMLQWGKTQNESLPHMLMKWKRFKTPVRPFWSLLFITRLQADPCGLDALWLLPVKHHGYELQAEDAEI